MTVEIYKSNGGGVVDLNQNELACRLFEAIIEKTRPPSFTAEALLTALDDDTRASILRAALAAMNYFVEQAKATVIAGCSQGSSLEH